MTLITAVSFSALGISVVTLIGAIIAFLRSTPPDVAEVKSRLIALDQEITDVNDRLSQWMRRESVRKMRAGKEEAAAAALDAPVDRKAELRRRLHAARQQT